MNRSFYLIFLIILFSCNLNPKKEAHNGVSKRISQVQSKSPITFFKFKDTAILNEDILGELKYNLELDSLKSSDIAKRYTLLYITTQREAIDLESIKNTNHNIFIDTVGNGTFYFNAKFTDSGGNLLNGVIEDLIFLKKITDEGETEIIRKKTNISKDIFIKEVGNGSK